MVVVSWIFLFSITVMSLMSLFAVTVYCLIPTLFTVVFCLCRRSLQWVYCLLISLLTVPYHHPLLSSFVFAVLFYCIYPGVFSVTLYCHLLSLPSLFIVSCHRSLPSLFTVSWLVSLSHCHCLLPSPFTAIFYLCHYSLLSLAIGHCRHSLLSPQRFLCLIVLVIVSCHHFYCLLPSLFTVVGCLCCHSLLSASASVVTFHSLLLSLFTVCCFAVLFRYWYPAILSSPDLPYTVSNI